MRAARSAAPRCRSAVIVLDASALAELLLGGAPARGVERAISGHDQLAPDSVDVEVLHALWGIERRGMATPQRTAKAVGDFGRLRLQRVPVAGRHADVWALRHAVSVYDAAYVALAQRLGCGMLTLDRRLAAGAPRGVAITVI